MLYVEKTVCPFLHFGYFPRDVCSVFMYVYMYACLQDSKWLIPSCPEPNEQRSGAVVAVVCIR
jgi:hypothetical protein